MKDALRLLIYFAATVVIGALIAPILFWTAQWIAAHGILPQLATFHFEIFFHRALLVAAIILLWPLLKSIRSRRMSDLALAPNPKWARDLSVGFALAAIPLLCCGAILIWVHIFSLRSTVRFSSLLPTLAAAITVPFIEEAFFRGLILGVLRRSNRSFLAVIGSSAFYSILHFLKSPARKPIAVTWTSGFNSIAHSFAQFSDPILVAAGFTTLLLIGCILADARLRTRSLWLPIGLHAGWIFANGSFSKLAHRDMLILPWLGKNLLVGIVPLAIAGLTWVLMHCWFNWNGIRKT